VAALGVVAGLALLGEVADVGARHLATSKVEQRIGQAVPESRGVRARIRSWPFLKVAVDGRVDEVGAHVARLVEPPLVFTDVDVDLRGVRLSVADMVTDARVNVTHIDRGRVTLTVTEANLVDAVAGIPVGGQALGPVGGLLGRAQVSVDAATRRLVIAVPGVTRLTLPLPGTDIVPCLPSVVQRPAALTLSCTFTRVPSAFTSVASSA
jgi:hypothetical protein